MKASLRNVADIVLAVAAAAVATVVVLRYATERRLNAQPPLYKTGDVLPTIPGVDFTEADHTLLLVLRSNCGFCTTSMPFYRRLVAAGKQRGHLRVLAVGSEERASFTGYLQKNRLDVDQVVTVAPRALNTGATPTLILADRARRVTGVWVGRLPEDKERAVMEASDVCEGCKPIELERSIE